ncbi:MAG: hypothetical protein ACD_61C00209G0002 [uncultured bacterium]|nr:MAG: hypothetical protein ACD_61C00209G0002 [uncultured bacterium]
MANLRKVLHITVLFFLIFSFFGAISPVQAILGCKDYFTPKDCNANCSPVKASGNRFVCKWNYSQGSCIESSALCSPSTTPGPVNLGDCPATIVNNCVRLDNGARSNASHFFCPNMTSGNLASAGCSLNEKRLSNVNEVCFQRTCGTEQIDFDNVNGVKCFESRVSDKACGSVTATPTSSPTVTPTPTPTVIPMVCQQMRVFLNGVNITTNLGVIKYGSVVTYRAIANKSGRAVKSFTFRVTLNGAIVETVVVPATLSNGSWIANLKRTVNKYGTYRVRVIAVTPK